MVGVAFPRYHPYMRPEAAMLRAVVLSGPMVPGADASVALTAKNLTESQASLSRYSRWASSPPDLASV